MKIYRTHLIVEKKDSKSIEKLKLASAKFILKPEPSNCFWDVKGGTIISHYSLPEKPDYPNSDAMPMMELLIEAENQDNAENILSLIHGGILLAYPEPSTTLNFVDLLEYNEDDNKWYNEKPFFNYLKKIDNVGFGCKVASIAIKSKQLTYSLEKYIVSLGLTSFTPKSADPTFGQVFDNHNLKNGYQTRAAFAIISAYSVIEELELEIRASSTNPRFSNNKTGEWNPVVLNDLIERLKKANISEDLTFDWIFRGEPTKIEKKTGGEFGIDSRWINYHKDVRDKTYTFPEAIQYASYLRSVIASHKFKELTRYISPYDVNNVQSLARHLIIRKMKMWNTMINWK